jgi:hypothetical protein
MTKTYFVLGTPGTSGIFLANLLSKYLDVNSSYPSLVNQVEYAQTPPEIITPEFFYDNLVVSNNLTNIFYVGMKPNFEKLRNRFPDSKFIVITHTLNEMQFISNYLFENYFKEHYDAGAEIPFKQILQDHRFLFSNIDATPYELSKYEEEAFKKVLQYHKLLDGYSNITEPETNSLLKIAFSDMMYFKNRVLDKLSSFTGIPTPESAVEFYGILDTIIDKRFNK